jgi:hypothetical protein
MPAQQADETAMKQHGGLSIVTLLLIVGICLLPGGCKKKKVEIPYPDYTSPKNAAVTFARAMEKDDVAIAKEASIAGGMEVDLLEDMCHATHALKELGKVTRDKFGEQADPVLRGNGSIDASHSLEAGEVTMEGSDRATVTPAGEVKEGEHKAVVPVKLDEDLELWKVDVGALIKGDDVTRSIPLLKVVAVAAKDVRTDLEAGKFKTAEEVKIALQTRIVTLANQSGTSTTLPTSLPVNTGGN